jgi:hypothetical protein
MTIQRAPHDKINPYAMINRNALHDQNLSWQAKGLLAYLISLPDDWKIQVSHLSKQYGGKGGGERAIYSMLNELIAQGYCERTQSKDKRGFACVQYFIYEFKKSLPHRSNADARDADARKSDLTNKRSLLVQESVAPKETKEQQQQQKEVVVVVSEIANKMKEYLKRFSISHGKQWNIPNTILCFLIGQYGDQYVSDQLNYMTDQHLQSILDQQANGKIKKTKPIEKPKTYLQMACDNNWASSVHAKNEKK